MWFTDDGQMEIILLRHGKPDVSIDSRISIRQLSPMIAAYNNSGVSQSAPAASINIAQSCEHIVCSDLPRSIQSAQRLGLKHIHVSSPVFREVDLPVSVWPSPKMSAYFWFAFFRLIWFMGHRAKGESLSAARVRAATGMRELTQLAQTHGRVLLVGHGLLNQFIAKQLLANGWQGPRHPGSKHWEYSCYKYTGR